EEARPAAHYHFYLASGERSPLATASADPFVVGGFEIDTDGVVHTPLAPDDEAGARARGRWAPGPGSQRADARGGPAGGPGVGRGYPEPDLAGEDLGAKSNEKADKTSALEPAPGSTQALSKPLADAPPPQEAAKERDEATAYDVLQRFSLAAQERGERKQKVE